MPMTPSAASTLATGRPLHADDPVGCLDLGDGSPATGSTDPAGEHHHDQHPRLRQECGELVAFEDPGLERSIDELSHRLGFTATNHELTLRGSGSDCR